MSFPTGNNTKARGEWSGWLLAAVCALLLAAPAQSTPLLHPSSASCANVLAWLQNGETATIEARREAVIKALCEAGAFNRNEAETLLHSLQTSVENHSAPLAFVAAPSTAPPGNIAPRIVGATYREYSLSPHEAAFLSGVRTNRILC